MCAGVGSSLTAVLIRALGVAQLSIAAVPELPVSLINSPSALTTVHIGELSQVYF